MKKILLPLVTIATAFILQSCVKDKLQSTYTYYEPVYTAKSEVLQNIKSALPRPLQKTGKLFLYGSFIFINEINKGIHIIDNADPRTPKNIGFISIPGNLDLAVKGHSLYADLYTDMITIDITNPGNIALKKVNSRVFPEREYVSGAFPDTTKYITNWVKRATTNKSDLENKNMRPPIIWYASSQSGNGSTKDVAGVSGSMARFTVVNNYLYTVGEANLTAFNITEPMDPKTAQVNDLGWNIETIYPLKDKLFIGSQTGMFIYSVANPASPEYLGNFQHVCVKDPVIADDNYAYVTLRAMSETSPCWGTPAEQRNELDILDISNILQPTPVKVYEMAEPKGLSKDGDLLFICDGKAGLKIFNAANVHNLAAVKTISDINPFDVICQNGRAIVVADEGIYQYDYSDTGNIQLISKLAIDQQ